MSKYMYHCLKETPENFLEQLKNNIIRGSESFHETTAQLKTLVRDGQVQLLEKYTDSKGDTFLHHVALFHEDTRILQQLTRVCPSLITKPRKGEFEGQTALHIVISKGNVDAMDVLIRKASSEGMVKELLEARATGSRFHNTVMMGELPLSVAALTLNTEVVDILLENGASLHAKNSRYGDTVLHSLVRFANKHSERLELVLDMLEYLNEKLPQRPSQPPGGLTHYLPDKKDPLAVWFLEDDEGLTPLRLAVNLGQVEIFKTILNLDGVYRYLHEHDGLYDIHMFDITEIDTVAHQSHMTASAVDAQGKLQQKQPSKHKNSQSNLIGLGLHTCLLCGCGRRAMDPKSVLEMICCNHVKSAFDLINVNVVKSTIECKWQKYKCIFSCWLLLHMGAMMSLTAYAIYKTEVINYHIFQNESHVLSIANVSVTSEPFTQHPTPTSQQKLFVQTYSYITAAYGLWYIFLEAVRTFYMRKSCYFRLIHQNGMYRLILFLFSLSLIIDCVWFWLVPDNNYFLVVTLLLGWWFVTFFLRACKRFSFFTVMFQKVLLGDMLRFGIVILLQLIGFSVAMHVTFLNSKHVPDEFRHLGVTVLTMFKLMLGLTDIETLYQARHYWMAITLFVLFVLVTYVLLINSLIAMLSQTCSLVSQDRTAQWELQRLSVILLLESSLPPKYRHLPGEAKYIPRYRTDKAKSVSEKRFFMDVVSVQTRYSDGEAILGWHDLIRSRDWTSRSIHRKSLRGTVRQLHGSTYYDSSARHFHTADMARAYNLHRRSKINKLDNVKDGKNDNNQTDLQPLSSLNRSPPRLIEKLPDERHSEENDASFPISDLAVRKATANHGQASLTSQSSMKSTQTSNPVTSDDQHQMSPHSPRQYTYGVPPRGVIHVNSVADSTQGFQHLDEMMDSHPPSYLSLTPSRPRGVRFATVGPDVPQVAPESIHVSTVSNGTFYNKVSEPHHQMERTGVSYPARELGRYLDINDPTSEA